MGSGALSQATDGNIIPASDHNQVVNAMLQDQVPRGSSGNSADVAGSLGTSSLRWLKCFVASGHWDCGDVKLHHSYNGAAPVGEGWMKCDGRLVNQTTYDAEHGSGHWAIYVGTSPLNGLYLPNFSDKYPMGKAATTQDGTVAITPVGNTSHQVNLQHSHTVNSHSHSIQTNGGSYGSHSTLGDMNLTTGAASPGTDNQLSATQSVQPESIEVQVYMRII